MEELKIQHLTLAEIYKKAVDSKKLLESDMREHNLEQASIPTPEIRA